VLQQRLEKLLPVYCPEEDPQSIQLSTESKLNNGNRASSVLPLKRKMLSEYSSFARLQQPGIHLSNSFPSFATCGFSYAH